MSDMSVTSPPLPPRWFVKLAWRAHRALYRVTGGRKGLRTPDAGSYGMMRLTTTGRRSGKERSVILAYLEDGPNLVTLAMNGWSPENPAWFLNLQANPQAVVVLPTDTREVRARIAVGDERNRLWDQWRRLDDGDKLDAYATRRPDGTPVIVLESLH